MRPLQYTDSQARRCMRSISGSRTTLCANASVIPLLRLRSSPPSRSGAMLFNSLPFLFFIVLFAAGWPLARGRDGTRWVYIIACSLFFYGWWNWKYVPLLVATALVDFAAGLAIHT